MANPTPLSGPPPGPSGIDFARSLSDATRQKIMERCCCRWCSVGDLVEALEGQVTQPTVSHHLAVLREARLVRSRREGRQVFYTLDQAEVARCCRWLVSTFAPESQAAQQLRQDITLHDTAEAGRPVDRESSSVADLSSQAGLDSRSESVTPVELASREG